MIAELRRTHRFASVALAVAVPVVFAAAIASRPDLPVNSLLPSGTYAPDAVSTIPLAWSHPDVSGELARRADGRIALDIDARSIATAPDVLVYWLEPNDKTDPPEAGSLLGALRGTHRQLIDLPAGAAERGGRLALYSLTHDEIIATSTVAPSGGQQ